MAAASVIGSPSQFVALVMAGRGLALAYRDARKRRTDTQVVAHRVLATDRDGFGHAAVLGERP